MSTIKNNLPEYSTLDEKREFFAAETPDYKWVINTTEEFNILYDKLSKDYNNDFESGRHNLLYRGVNEARFKTFTSAQRYWLWNEWKDNTRSGFIEYIKEELFKIKRNNCLRNFYRSLNVIPNDLLYLTFLQHFGGASPMLDLTHNLDTGLFFAIDNAQKDSNSSRQIDEYISLQIWDCANYLPNHIINLVDMLQSSLNNAEKLVSEYKDKYPDVNIDASLIENIDKFTAWSNPQNNGEGLNTIPIGLLDYSRGNTISDTKGRRLYWSNIRIIAQKGVMLLYPNSDMPVEDYISNILKVPKIRCINIHKDLREHIEECIHVNKCQIYPSEKDMASEANKRVLSMLTIRKTTT